MTVRSCLTDLDLVLHYYGELPEDKASHLTDCLPCRKRFEAMALDLKKLPELSCEVSPSAATRITARVSNRIQQKRRVWLPATGGALAMAAALVVTFFAWNTDPEQHPFPQPSAPTEQFALSAEDMPEMIFLEELELLEDLELLRQIEGV